MVEASGSTESGRGRRLAGGRVDEGDLFDRAVFDAAWRGYHRGQVDSYVGELVETAGWERRRAQAVERRLEAARERLREVLEVGKTDGRVGGGLLGGFGARVEQLIETAEREASQLLDTASREAAELVERARQDGEAHRRSEQAELDARAAELADELDRRTEGLARRAQEVEQVVAAAHAEAERVGRAAAHDEQVCLSEATRQAEALLERATADAALGHAAVQAELERFAWLRELVGEQIEHFRCPVQDELAEPTCDEAGGDPDGDRVCGAAAAGPDPPDIG